MPRTLTWKKQEIEKLKKLLDDAKGVVVFDCTGINVESINDLRSQMRASSLVMKVSKNTMLKKAIGDNPVYQPLLPLLKGANSFVFAHENGVAPCSILKKFYDENEKPLIKGGVIEGSYFDQEALNKVAILPSKEGLLSQVARGLQAPIVNFVFVLNALLRNLTTAFDEIRKKKELSG